MQIKRNPIKRLTIEQFADQHGLVMEIDEYATWPQHMMPFTPGRSPTTRFTASFEHAEVKDGPILSSAYGNGTSEAEAIADYARQISGKLLVIDATSEDRFEIEVPILSSTKPDTDKEQADAPTTQN